MKYIIEKSILLTILFITGCKNNLEKNEALDHPNVIVDSLNPGEELDINKFTHGDTPVWYLEDYSKSKLDIGLLLKEKDSLSLESLNFRGDNIWLKTKKELMDTYSKDIQNENLIVQEVNTEYKSEGISKGKENYISFIIKDMNLITLKDQALSDLDVKDFKKVFPTSYAVRNWYFDDFVSRNLDLFTNNPPDSYDHIIVKVEGIQRFFRFRFIDGKPIEVEFTKDPGY